MRTLASACAVTAAAAASLLLAPAAYATPTPPGDNGTVKIHNAETDREDKHNEPKVCTFYLDAFGFDGGQEVSWSIVEMPPTGTKGTVADEGQITLDEEGHGRTEDMNLENGHYKLVWTFEGENGKAKHKVFWTDCEDDKPDEPDGSATPSTSTSPEASSKPSGEPSTDASGSPVASQPAGSPLPNGGGDLAETGAGAPVGALASAAAALLGVGGYLVFRRRNSAAQD